ncbi:MAG: phytanoyl-CoA dioxygenase family protein [Pseudomonadota bacterium]
MNVAAARQEIVSNIEKMRRPRPLTEDVELTEAEQRTVKQTIADTKEKGYGVYEGFLMPEQLEQVREKMAPIYAITGNRKTRDKGDRWTGTQTIHIHNLFAKTRAADEIAIAPVMLALVEGVLGPNFQMSVGTAMNPGPGADAQGFHQDDGHWPLPRPHFPLVANTLIALDDFTADVGATMVVPGSHQWTKPIEQDTGYIQVEMPAGSVLIWDGAVWHAGGANTSADRYRRSINLNYNLDWLRQQENQYIGIPRDVLLALPEKLQRLLGYQKANRLCGGVDYQDPLDYLRKLEN